MHNILHLQQVFSQYETNQTQFFKITYLRVPS